MRITALALLLSSLPVTAQPGAHQAAVENGLSTGYSIVGSTPKRMKLTDRMTYHHIPGATVAVIHGGRLEWSGAYGAVEPGGKAVTDTTLFNVASVSKSVTAVGVMRLVQQRKIDLDKDVNGYLQRWKIPASAPVTTRMLLNHTAGFGDSPGVIYKRSALPTLLQQLNGEVPAANPPVKPTMEPGRRFEYSNNGYLVLQLLVEDVTGKPFAEAMRSLVLSPLAMTHSTFENPLPLDLAAHAAKAFGPRQRIGTPADDFGISNLAAGGLWTNATDLAKFAIEIQSAWLGKNSKILTHASALLMTTRGEGFPKEVQGLGYHGEEHWGLGLELAGSVEQPYFDHGGGAVYTAYLFMYRNGDGMVVTTNEAFGFRLIHELLRSAGQVYHWADFAMEERPRYAISEAELARLLGNYQGIRVSRGTTGELRCTLDLEEHTISLIPWSTTGFISPDMALKFEFHLDPVTHQAVSLDVQSLQDVFNVRKDEPEKVDAEVRRKIGRTASGSRSVAAGSPFISLGQQLLPNR